MLTPDRLRELLVYTPETGVFTNRTPRKKIRVGDVAGAIDKSNGYAKITIDRSHYYAHRLAFLYMTGAWPVNHVDHINGERADNRWANLRDVSRTVNQQNMRRASKTSRSGLLGAFKKRDRWESRIRVQGTVRHLGVFGSPEEAHAAYITAKRQAHPGCSI